MSKENKEKQKLLTSFEFEPGKVEDVFDEETLPFNSLLLRLPNITLTSHLAGTTGGYYF